MRHDSALPFPRLRATFASLTLIALLAACGAKDGAPAAAPAAAPPPPEVGVITVSVQPVALQTELPGRIEPVRVAQVRARVNGVVQQRLFREGSEVKAGQPLFQIDASPYQATLASAQAAMGKAQANLTQASSQAERYKPLVEANAVSKQDYVNVIAAQKQAEADVAAARAAITTASINVNYARVVAPISGRIGRALVTEGALVSQTEATQLAVIQQIDKVYVNFTQSANELQALRRTFGSPSRNGADSVVPVTVLTDDGTELPNKGRLLFSDLSVDPTSGQVTLRAEMSNQDGALLPGQYVRVRLSQASVPAGILLPQQAVTRGTRGDTVLVVGPDNKPVPRPVKVGSAQGTQWVVLEGLKPGEQVIVDGFQKMMAPGAPVKPVPWKAPAASGPAPAAGPAPASAPASAPAPAPTPASAPAAAPAPARAG